MTDDALGADMFTPRSIGGNWQGRQGSNLRHPVLETGTLPTELHPCSGPSCAPSAGTFQAEIDMVAAKKKGGVATALLRKSLIA